MASPRDEEAIAFLSTATLFKSLSSVDLRAVHARMTARSFAANELIFSRGDEGNGAYLVLKGRVRLSVVTEDGRELSLALAGPGSFFGEIASLDGGGRTTDATALTAVDMLFLSRSAFLAEIETRPALARAAIDLLCSRMRDTDERLEAIALHSVEVRLARYLLSCATTRHPGVTSGRHPVELGISQSEIALLIGASRPKVNLALTGLEEARAIRREGSIIHCDIARLIDVCAG